MEMEAKIPPARPERLKSLDILRGFDMFWITGGEGLFHALAAATGWGLFNTVSQNLHHAKWEGFMAYDLIFPLFIFIMGVAIPYALMPRIEEGGSLRNIYKKIFRRFLLLVVFGIFYNQVWLQDWSNPRIASVLGQIGFAYLFAAIIFLKNNTFKGVLAWMLGILAGISVLQLWTPVPGYGAGELTQAGSINAYIDQLLLPGLLLDSTFDPEGLLNNVSAIGIALMGVFSGLILRKAEMDGKRKFFILVGLGGLLLILSYLVEPYYPVIKKAWTTSFNLRAGGFSFLLLSIAYLVVDVWKYDRWGFYFKVIGVNAITIYLGSSFIDFSFTSRAVLGGFLINLGDWAPVIISAGALALEWMVLVWMYRNKIFLKV